jgi:DNA-directed RNA polymerase alpha subunit
MTQIYDLDAMGFSTRARLCFNYYKIVNLSDLLRKSPKELLSMKNIGKKSLRGIINVLSSYGFSLRNDTDKLSISIKSNPVKSTWYKLKENLP